MADEAARSVGARAVALGTSPLPTTPTLVPQPRYLNMAARFGLTLQEQLTCGFHVHVRIRSAEEGVAILDRIRIWLPVVLALSGNSPFWRGTDSGYASFRYQAWSRWQTAGPCERFGSAREYRRHVQSLLATGVLLDEGMVYFDARLSRSHPTVEVRIADVCLEAGHATAIAALVRALVGAGSPGSGSRQASSPRLRRGTPPRRVEGQFGRRGRNAGASVAQHPVPGQRSCSGPLDPCPPLPGRNRRRRTGNHRARSHSCGGHGCTAAAGSDAQQPKPDGGSDGRRRTHTWNEAGVASCAGTTSISLTTRREHHHMDVDDKVRSYLDDNLPVLIDRLTEWVRIPSVAGVPERKHNLTRSANWLAGELRDVGFPTTEIWEGADGPAVYAEWSGAPGAPTVLIYSHHDVRAVKEENWDQTSPFDPVRAGRPPLRPGKFGCQGPGHGPHLGPPRAPSRHWAHGTGREPQGDRRRGGRGGLPGTGGHSSGAPVAAGRRRGDFLRHPAVAGRSSGPLHQHPRHARGAARGLRSADGHSQRRGVRHRAQPRLRAQQRACAAA